MSGSVVDNTVSSGNSSVAIPTDISGQILDLDEDDDLEVFSKVIYNQLVSTEIDRRLFDLFDSEPELISLINGVEISTSH